MTVVAEEGGWGEGFTEEVRTVLADLRVVLVYATCEGVVLLETFTVFYGGINSTSHLSESP